jgi:hypothetical protein
MLQLHQKLAMESVGFLIPMLIKPSLIGRNIIKRVKQEALEYMGRDSYALLW